jgi:hypothetical protein
VDGLAGLLDDAAVFPPGNAPVGAAVPAHHDHRAAWYAEMVGPFVFPAARLAELTADGRPLALAVTCPAGNLVTALGAAGLDGASLAAVEVVPAADGDPADGVAALDALLPADVLGYVEVPRGTRRDPMLDALAGTRYRAKFRTGGTVPEAHPGERELAETLLAAVSRDVPFKCTAGLHHAIRHTDGDLEQHGFLNVLLATDAALAGGAAADLAALLAERSADTVAARVAALGEDRVAAARRWFVSFGTCSIDDPVADLVGLGLLDKPAGVDQR